MNHDELNRLREENTRLKAEIAELNHLRAADAAAAQAELAAAHDALEAYKVRVRNALLRTIEAEDEVFSVREEAAAAVQRSKEA